LREVQAQPLAPGTLLRNGRYRLREVQESQEWLDGVFEATWSAQDVFQGGTLVSIRELAFLETSSEGGRSILRTATTALLAIGRHPRVPALRDAFNDQGRSFFVFEHMEGESLQARLQYSGRPLEEQEVIEICLQMSEILELQAEQIPLLVHGLINPGHILVGRSGSQYVLTNFSVLLAGNATQFVAGIDRVHLSPYAAPEVTYGTIDGRSDLYSLLATAYYLVTGRLPERVNASIPSARRINANVSAEFEAFLVKGLLQVPSRRYQHPAELRLALLTMRSSGSSLMRGYSRQSEQVPQAFLVKSLQSQAQVLPGSLLQEQPHLSDWRDEEEEHHRLLPRPENLPMMRRGHDTLNATLWLLTILVTMIAVIILAKGTF
jgi:serine/threonine protein kinase